MKSKYIFFLTLLFIHSAFVDLRPLSVNNVNLYVQMLSALFLIVLVLKKIPLFFAKYKLLNISLCLFVAAYSMSTYNVWHKHILIALQSPYTSILEFIKVVSVVFVMQYIKETNKVNVFLKYFLIILGIYLFVANIEALGGKVNDMDICILGDKFVLSYTNLFWISIFCYYRYVTTYHFNLLQYQTLLVLSFLMSGIIGCATGVIVATSMLILSILDISFISKIMVSPLNLIVAILVCDLGFYFTYETILKNDFVKYLEQEISAYGNIYFSDFLLSMLAISSTDTETDLSHNSQRSFGKIIYKPLGNPTWKLPLISFKIFPTHLRPFSGTMSCTVSPRVIIILFCLTF